MDSEICFYDNKDFKWVDQLQNNWKNIQQELLNIIDLPASYEPSVNWLAAHPDYVKNEKKSGINWKTFELLFFGIQQKKHVTMCPETWKLISQVPELVTVQFSLLEPNTHVQPHKGFTRMVLRSHLGLIVPKSGDMALRVGNEKRTWKEGEVMIFDDSLEHEAWNHSNERRAVLMFDFAKPGIGYNADQICRYKIERTDDPFLLKIAPKEKWMEWYEQGFFPQL